MTTPINTLYYGDNLDILRQYIPSESVDLIYLDPPFNSARDYNVLFSDEQGKQSEAQIKAFKDTWYWDRTAEQTYYALVEKAPEKVTTAIGALRQLIGANQMMAYLVMMTARLVELHRVLKPTGSLYLHCDPTASHYLKLILDVLFGAENFRNEIVWSRTPSKSHATRRLPDNHDIIFLYHKSAAALWNGDAIRQAYDLENLDEKTALKYRYRDENGRLYRLDNLINPNKNRPNLTYEFMGVTRVWRWTKARMQQAYADGLIVQTAPGRVPQFKRYLDVQKGKPLGDVWTDISPLNSQARERLGYPTQKPVALLERIIAASSNPGDVVLDPFAGCGSAIAAAQKLGRHWLGIDITHLSIALLKYRLQDTFDQQVGRDFNVVGEPEDIGAARQLAHENRYQFQWWALSLIKAKPLGGSEGSREGKKGSDKGIDGVINFAADSNGKLDRVLIQVKSGKVKSGDIRDLIGVLDREKAAMGIFITLEPPSADMRKEAVSAGYYKNMLPYGKPEYPRLQIVTIEQLLAGDLPDLPVGSSAYTFKRAEKNKAAPDSSQTSFLDDA